MKTEIQSHADSNCVYWLEKTVTACNFSMKKIKKIINTPSIPVSCKIHQYLLPLVKSLTPKINRDATYFRDDIYPYKNHLYISIAVKIMKKKENQQLLGKLYHKPNHYIKYFFLLSGIAGGIPEEVNQDIFQQLVSVLQNGKALKQAESTEESVFNCIPRDIVLLNFFSSFLSSKIFTLSVVNEGVKGLLISAITMVSPGLGSAIKILDSFTPLTLLFPHRTNDIDRLLREETGRYDLTQKQLSLNITLLKNLFSLTPAAVRDNLTTDHYASSSTTAVNTPLLLGTTAIAIAHQSTARAKTIAGITALGMGVSCAIYRYLSLPQDSNSIASENSIITNINNTHIIHSVSYGEKPHGLNQLNPAGQKGTCYDIEKAIKELLTSNKAGLRLVDEFCHFIFNEHGDLNVGHAHKLLKKWDITNFSPFERTEMSVLLTYILSVLLTPVGKKEAFDLNELIFSTGEEVNQIWLRNINKKQQESINEALQQTRLYVSGQLVKTLGAIDLSKTEKLINFIVLLCAPDLIQFKNHNKGDLDVVSKETYYYWNYLGKEYSENKYVLHDDFDFAINEGRKYGFYLRRRKFYDGIPKLSPIRELFENFTSSINRDFINYHENDVKLERLIFPTFDDVIEDAYLEKNINVVTSVNFDRESLRINLQPYIDPHGEIEYLRGCKNIRDVIRSFPDGMDVLRRRLPNLVPHSLRSYATDDTNSFVLRPHPKRDELKDKHEKMYQQVYNEHIALYKTVVRLAFEMDPNYELFNNPLVEISIVELDNRRIQKVRTMLMPKSFRFKASIMYQVGYNSRRHYQRGAIFIAENIQTKERKFFAINIEASRIYRQLPITTLAINKTEDIAGLPNDFLNRHYKFHDGKPFWDPCDEEKAFKESLVSPPEKMWDYITERLKFVKAKVCKATRSDKEIISLFYEKKLGRSANAVKLLQKEIANIREKYLSYEKEEIESSRETEREHDIKKGKWQLFKEKLPLYSCVEMIDDMIIPHEDIVLTSLLENVFQGVLCASDAYLLSSVIKKVTGLEHLIKKASIQKIKKMLQLDTLRQNLKISIAIQKPSPALEQSINKLRKEINHLDEELKSTFEKIFLTGLSVASKPTEILYPIFSFGSGKTFIFPLAAGIGKKQLKELKSGLKSYIFYPWVKPSAKELVEKEHHILLTLQKKNITCYSDDSPPLKITTNIFDIHTNNPELYHTIFFAMLKNPDIQTIIDVADAGGWKIPNDHDEMAMFCFRSFIAPVWHYVGEIIDLDKHYNLNPNRSELNAGMFFDYLNDNLIKRNPISNIILTADQNLLISQSFKAINSTLESDSEAFQFNYLFMLKQVFLSEDLENLLQASEKEKKRKHKEIVQNIHYKLGKTTLYSTHSAMQENFHIVIINYFTQAMNQTIRERPAAITLFSANIEIFNHRCQQYRQHHPGEVVPTLAEFIRNQIWMENEFERIYQPFARIEYSARVLDNYTEEQWLNADAQADWLAKFQEYLSPQMRSQNLALYLKDVTKKILAGWQHEQRSATIKNSLEIIIADDVNPIFISLVKNAMQQCCDTYPTLLFCQYYQLDNGSRFTFLTNDFISEPQQRSRRQLLSEHPFYPLPSLNDEQLTDVVISPLKSKLPSQKKNETLLYQQELNNILQNFIYFSALPFHERLYGHTMSMLTPEREGPSDAATLINTILDENGNLINCQLKVLQRNLPTGTIIDEDRLLQLLSDIFKLASPTAPDLYDYAFRQLQIVLSSSWMTLAHLTNANFIKVQSLSLTQQFQQHSKINYGTTLQAVRRYMTAAVSHFLDFTTQLKSMDAGMASIRLKDVSAQKLCLGAIIAQNLQLETVSQGALLKLFSVAMQDAGIIPVAAQQQIALLTRPGRHTGEDALHCVATCLEHTATIQTYILACVDDSQALAAYLTELHFATSSSEQQQRLLSLFNTALQSHQQLLTIAMPASKEQQLRQAHARGELQFTWYQTGGKNEGPDLTVVGIGFDIINNNEGILFPYSLSFPATGMFHQKPAPLTDEALTAICFDPASKDIIHFNRTTVVPAPLANRQNNNSVITTLFNWIKVEVQEQLHQLAAVQNEADFITQKKRAVAWLMRHFPFYIKDNILAEQLKSEHIIKLAAHPAVNKWKTRSLARPQNMSSIYYFDQAITEVMGKYTDWPADASVLRSRRKWDHTLSAGELPMTGFRGIWWDPMRYVCYVGFINENERALYASLPENREVLYLLADRFAHARIWEKLSLYSELQADFSALRRGQLSALAFFEQSIPVAWRRNTGNATESWHLVKNEVASQLLRQGVFTPDYYLQADTRRNEINTQLTPYVLQYHSGNIVFVFSEDNYQKARYGIIDSQGVVQSLPEEFTDWPHLIHTSDQISSKQLFNATIEDFIIRQQRELLPEFLPLLTTTELQQNKSLLFNAQAARREHIRLLSNITTNIPFRMAIDTDGLIDIDVYLKRHGRSLNNELQQRIHADVELSDRNWNVFTWRDDDLYDERICNNSIKNLIKKQAIFTALNELVTDNPLIALHRTPSLTLWIEHSRTYLSRAIDAIEWFKSRGNRPSFSDTATSALHLDSLAKNSFFSYFGAQPYVTPELFAESWAFRFDQRRSTIQYHAWQQALDQLHLLVMGIPDNTQVLNQFLSLPEHLWQAGHMQTCARQVHQIINSTLHYWRQSHQAQQLVLIRPTALMSTQYNHPINMILSAVAGHLTNEEKAPPLSLSTDQFTDLLLVNPAPQPSNGSAIRLAGINSAPRTAADFAAWAKNRLAGPVFMNELSGSAFLFRLQSRIDAAMVTDSNQWGREERNFYGLSDTTRFLQLTDFGVADKRRFLDFFKALFASDVLVARLILPDVEMVFGLLCDYFKAQHPERATEDFSMAWFLFSNTFGLCTDEDATQPLYLVGV
ncbi:MAG: hypothetical protein PW844_08250 [Pantoea sp.]|uniref:hypothetical protein n=1 Tax=Pantoea sp. TaxID=69393 RepID=UPI0023932B1E|nr:hypothetical protein [Pantoea sp.]MDE1186455.1 hypothetical protein [Pantoea sp.]